MQKLTKTWAEVKTTPKKLSDEDVGELIDLAAVALEGADWDTAYDNLADIYEDHIDSMKAFVESLPHVDPSAPGPQRQHLEHCEHCEHPLQHCG